MIFVKKEKQEPDNFGCQLRYLWPGVSNLHLKLVVEGAIVSQRIVYELRP